jgi:hypothetical protein
MALRITLVQPLDTNGTWQFTWAGTTPFSLSRDGRALYDDTIDGANPLSTTTALLTRTFTDGTEYEPPQIEVLDSADSYTAQNLLYPPWLTLQWHEAPEAGEYRIDQYVDAAWTAIRSIPATDRGYYYFETPKLVDGTTYQYRVVPVRASGTDMSPLYFTLTLVCLPEPPDVTFSVAAGVITTAARA